MSRVMIVGASRGIGLELTKQYAEAGDQVIACARDTAAAEKLDSLTEASKNIVIKKFPSIYEFKWNRTTVKCLKGTYSTTEL